jgi:hypothetical protein
VILIDAANVIGSRPDGWWRDRPGAAHRFVRAVRDAVAASRLPPAVVIVLEGAARHGAAESAGDGLTVVHAPRSGDDKLVAIASAATEPVILVTADRGLRDRVRASGVDVAGPAWLLDRLAST